MSDFYNELSEAVFSLTVIGSWWSLVGVDVIRHSESAPWQSVHGSIMLISYLLLTSCYFCLFHFQPQVLFSVGIYFLYDQTI